MLVKVANKDSTTLDKALIKSAWRLPKQLYRSLAWDPARIWLGTETFRLQRISKGYFCDPQKPWQRGSNESTNGLLRQYFHKGMDISNVSQAQLDVLPRKLNERPRKTLGYETPAERYRQCVASISLARHP
jgi:IS30 family transposase